LLAVVVVDMDGAVVATVFGAVVPVVAGFVAAGCGVSLHPFRTTTKDTRATAQPGRNSDFID